MCQRREPVCMLVLCVFSRRWMQSEGKESRQALRLPPSPSFRDSKHPLKREAQLRTSMQTLFNYRDQKCLHKTVTQRHLLSAWFYSLGNSSCFFFSFFLLFSPQVSLFLNRFFVLTILSKDTCSDGSSLAETKTLTIICHVLLKRTLPQAANHLSCEIRWSLFSLLAFFFFRGERVVMASVPSEKH